MTVDLAPQPEEILVVESQQFQAKIHVTMKIKGGYETTFQVDTGASCNVIRAGELRGKYEKSITQTNQVLKMYNSSPLKPVGKCRVQLTNPRNGKKYKAEFVVVKDSDASINLIGSRAAQQMNLIHVNPENLLSGNNEAVHVVQTPDEIGHTEEEIRAKYADVFQGLGELGESLHLEVDETVRPVQIPPRRIPEALRKPLKEHLEELEQQGVIEKVVQATDWVSAIVVNKKSNGKIRLCLDPQPLNKALKRCHYPIPTIEDVLPDLANAKVFTKLDCKNGYWQVKLDKDSGNFVKKSSPKNLSADFRSTVGRHITDRLPTGYRQATKRRKFVVKTRSKDAG